ncbi:hypothetical protein RJ640_016168 [Escallonia rubra]|uniref:Uncharacterized protein n=1 Tax=Escallonia rubra TaxID=112253 RepID=A0AA88SHJ0_9ASTE|nr:hypothetical protein RJ640_016168 [Escallonia rubra]
MGVGVIVLVIALAGEDLLLGVAAYHLAAEATAGRLHIVAVSVIHLMLMVLLIEFESDLKLQNFGNLVMHSLVNARLLQRSFVAVVESFASAGWWQKIEGRLSPLLFLFLFSSCASDFVYNYAVS